MFLKILKFLSSFIPLVFSLILGYINRWEIFDVAYMAGGEEGSPNLNSKELLDATSRTV